MFRKLIAIAAVLPLASGCADTAVRHQASPARAEDAPEVAAEVRWREYKLPLRPELCGDPVALATRFGAIATTTAEQHGGAVEQPKKTSKRASKKAPKAARDEVVLLDTTDQAFRRHGLVLRRRGREATPGRAATYEITLESRAADIRTARAAPVEAAAGVPSALDFKEEIVVDAGKPGATRTLWVLESGVRKTDRTRDLTLEDVIEVFPGLAGKLGDPSTPVSPVGGLRIEQTEIELPAITFGETAVRGSLIVWRDRDDGIVAAEYGFTEKIADYWSQPAGDVRAIRAYFSALQVAAPEWIAPTRTKTAAVYDRASARAARTSGR